MKIFTVYLSNTHSKPEETAQLVREGFSFSAAIFQEVWCLYHRIWRQAMLVFLWSAILSVLGWQEVISDSTLVLLNIVLLLWVGFEAYDWRRASLEERGYSCWGVVSGATEAQARQRFLDHYYRVSPLAFHVQQEIVA